MKKKYYILSACLTVFLFVGCGDNDTPEPLPQPGEFSLINPADNSACLKGKPESDLNSLLDFRWSQAPHAESYILEINNLTSQETLTFTTDNVSYSALLPANNHYAWKVIAVNSEGETGSFTWKFYLSGTPQSNYAPFPAELISPASGARLNSKGEATIPVTFSWIGSDVDDDIESYTFFLDNKDASTQIKIQNENSIELELERGESYYWKIITTDKAENKSVSELSWFVVE